MIRRRRPRTAQGSGSVLVASCVVLLSTVALALSVLGGLLVRQRRLESAADLAALAGAAAVQRGEDGCGRAAAVAHLNGARLTGCVTAGATVSVTVGGEARLPVAGAVSQRAVARAGPVG